MLQPFSSYLVRYFSWLFKACATPKETEIQVVIAENGPLPLEIQEVTSPIYGEAVQNRSGLVHLVTGRVSEPVIEVTEVVGSRGAF